ncbi:unnamed protein product, partial [Medioppia subpectinata]
MKRGLTLSSMAPAFVDYRVILNTEMEMIGTIAFKYVNRQILLSILIILQGLGTIFQPWATHLWHLYLCIFVYGFGIGAWNGSNNVILIEMWQNRSPSILQFSQFIYGVGTILGPLLDKNFVLGEQICPGVYEKDCHLAALSNETIAATDLCTDECRAYDRRPRLKIPLLIGGLLMMIGPIMMLAMYAIKKYHFNHDSKIEVVTTEEQKARHKRYVPSKTIIVCTSLYLAFGIMSENMYMDFAPTFYQFSPVKLTAAEASDLFSLVGIALTTGRGVSIFIAMYLKPEHMIAYQSVIVFIGQYTEVTDKIGGLFIGSYNAVYMFLPYFIGNMSLAIVAFIYVMWSVRNVPQDLIR